MLVDIFAGEFRAEKNAHLKNFHMIVPPLVGARCCSTPGACMRPDHRFCP